MGNWAVFADRSSWAGVSCERIEDRLQSHQRLRAGLVAVGATVPLLVEGSVRMVKGGVRLTEALLSRAVAASAFLLQTVTGMSLAAASAKQPSLQGSVQLLAGGGAELLMAVGALLVGGFAPEVVMEGCRAAGIAQSDAGLTGDMSLKQRCEQICHKQWRALSKIVEQRPVAALLLAGLALHGLTWLFAESTSPAHPLSTLQPKEGDGSCPFKLTPPLQLQAEPEMCPYRPMPLLLTAVDWLPLPSVEWLLRPMSLFQPVAMAEAAPEVRWPLMLTAEPLPVAPAVVVEQLPLAPIGEPLAPVQPPLTMEPFYMPENVTELTAEPAAVNVTEQSVLMTEVFSVLDQFRITWEGLMRLDFSGSTPLQQ